MLPGLSCASGSKGDGMEGFRDPTGATRAAIVALYMDMVLEALAAGLSLPTRSRAGRAISPPSPPYWC